jgi:hypothetical protein
MRYLFLCLWVTVCGHVWAQSPQQWGRHGTDALNEGDIYGAAFYFGKAATADSAHLDMWMAWADALRSKNDYAHAAEVYGYIYEHPLRSEDQAVALYYQARMLQSQGYYNDAAQAFRSYANYHAEKGSYWYLDARRQEESCNWALLNIADSSTVRPQTLGDVSNSVYSEFGGSLINDSTLVYSSLQYQKKDSSMLLARRETGNRVGIYHAVFRDSLWISMGLYDSLLSGAFHYGNAHFFADSSWWVYTECTGFGACKIFMRKRTAAGFGPPYAPGPSLNADGFNNTHPHIASFGGDVYLFFSSNRPQGQGNMDIWYSKYEPRYRQFGVPRNMGREINSPGNEITPFFLSDSSRLYFSSDWHDGFGGFDIFECKVASLRSPRPPKNLKLPINTSANDMYFALYPKDSLLFLSSNRPEGVRLEGETCCNDLYYYRLTPPLPDTAPPPPDTPIVVPPPVWAQYAPVLYFANDHPEPKTGAVHTRLSYSECYKVLMANRAEYTRLYMSEMEEIYQTSAQGAMDAFFNDKAESGYRELQTLLSGMQEALAAGKKITLKVKGFASPLAADHYNQKLSHRRIMALVNEIKYFQNGILKPYLEDEQPGGGRLWVEELPFGESKADPMVSDDLKNKAQSIYSPDACMERRVEIVEIITD